MDVVIDGIRYVEAKEQSPDCLSFWYMHDNHTFTKLYGTTLDAILEQADGVELESPGGMLCPVIVKRGEKELRRVGVGAHSSSDRARWGNNKSAWRAAIEKDADIMRLLVSNVQIEARR